MIVYPRSNIWHVWLREGISATSVSRASISQTQSIKVVYWAIIGLLSTSRHILLSHCIPSKAPCNSGYSRLPLVCLLICRVHFFALLRLQYLNRLISIWNQIISLCWYCICPLDPSSFRWIRVIIVFNLDYGTLNLFFAKGPIKSGWFWSGLRGFLPCHALGRHSAPVVPRLETDDRWLILRT